LTVLSLLLLSGACSVCLGLIVLFIWKRRRISGGAASRPLSRYSCARPCFLLWPGRWLAIKTDDTRGVQSALGLHNPKPCFWLDGLAREEKVFIAPALERWILVAGGALPDPSDDVDACFRLIVSLSRKLGEVQFFSVNRNLHHHAWDKARRGRVVRAYAWAGQTLWNQGPMTRAEKALNLKCYEYGETIQWPPVTCADVLGANVDKVQLLAARWSFDPMHIYEYLQEQERGIAGEPSRPY